MKIAIDTLGGDLGAEEVVKGVLSARETEDFDALLLGRKEELEECLSKYTADLTGISVVDAPTAIHNDEDPAIVIRKKKDASMVVGANLVSQDEADGLLSSGSTGALLASGLFIIKRMEGIERAALSVFFPTMNGFSLLLDAGANMDCKPEYLYKFALMGSRYIEKVHGKSNPRVALLNIGSEEGKGNKLTKETYELLKNSSLNFIGNVEPRELISGGYEVMVCDGFAGNVALKTTEGVAMTLLSLMKQAMMKNLKTKIGALMTKNEIKDVLKGLDYRETGGAPLLGLRKPVFKAHGSSDALAYRNAIKQMVQFIKTNVISYIEQGVKEW